MTKQRKVYAAFLGLAAAAFLGDRFFLQPAGAGAAPAVAEVVNSEAKPKVVEPVSSAPAGPALAVKLRKAAPTSQPTRDPFRRGEAPVVADAAGSTAAAADPVTPAEFAARYELQSVLRPGRGSSGDVKSVAVLAAKRGGAEGRGNGRAYSLGTEVGGWVMVEVGEKSATFERGSARVVLELKGSVKVDNRDVTGR